VAAVSAARLWTFARDTRASTEERSFKRNFAHRFGAEDFTDVESLDGGGAAFVFRARHFLDDRVHLGDS